MKDSPTGALYAANKPEVSGWADGYGVEDYRVSTNEKGLREESFSLEKPPNTTRILVIGDSFTFGLGVNRSDNFVERTEDRLNSSFPDENIQLINAGIPGTGMEDYYLFLKNYGVRYDPDIVVISFIGSDWYSKNDMNYFLEEARNRSGLTEEMTDTERVKMLKEELPEVHTEHLRNNPVGKTSLSYMDSIENLTDDKEFNTVYYAIGSIERPPIKSYIQSWENNHSEEFYRAPESFRNNLGTEVRLSEMDRHPNERGHRIIAGKLSNILNKRLNETQS